MPKKAPELSALAVRNLTRPGLHFVGGVAGLALQVTNTGARSWVLRIKVGSKRRDMGLGGFPDVPLADARNKARSVRDLVSDGHDPIQARKERRSALLAEQTASKTFKDCAEMYIAAHERGWKSAKHAAQWHSTLTAYVYPHMGNLMVGHVDKTHILAALEPIWNEKTETATRLRSRIELVLSYAMQRGFRPEGANPARWRGGLDKLLPAPGKVAKAGHYKALPVADVGRFMVDLRDQKGMAALALEFAILTAARSGEVRGVTWAEIDLVASTWTVPAARMKGGREHRVPLTAAAKAVLERSRAMPRAAESDLVFPSVTGKPLSDMTLSAVLRRMGVPATVHGFRSTFRDWTAERTSYPNEVCEMALAHSIGDKTEAAYRRGDLFDKRARLMADWERFLDRPETAGQVVTLKASRG